MSLFCIGIAIIFFVNWGVVVVVLSRYHQVSEDEGEDNVSPSKKRIMVAKWLSGILVVLNLIGFGVRYLGLIGLPALVWADVVWSLLAAVFAFVVSRFFLNPNAIILSLIMSVLAISQTGIDWTYASYNPKSYWPTRILGPILQNTGHLIMIFYWTRYLRNLTKTPSRTILQKSWRFFVVPHQFYIGTITNSYWRYSR